ncbi:Peptidase family M23 [Fontibacillus panacisegetis]|uniref:Peptidase family M23 n=1 Tax=Fontibacillus panacisegetis TaxID=670482 RepID=A0A1G7IQQ7_9BACL|nr:M23 family metallopeptidase [Fontibacillus panacisegetis]SDF14945.1 Peptidase family M23 [Fontibacillus panacisegetis]
MRSYVQFGKKSIRCLICTVMISFLCTISGFGAVAAEAPGTPDSTHSKSVYELRRSLYEEIGILTQVPWYWLAAVDQYERTITPRGKVAKKDKERLVGLQFKDEVWAGALNPNPGDMNPATISLFGGLGRDATADGNADPGNDRDALFTMASYLLGFGFDDEDFRIALWRYYQNDSSVSRIRQFAKIYKTFNQIDLSASAFPLPVKSIYTFRDTWGDRRGWGGLRTHEGTDLFASYGVPVRSVCYGIVETKGWNPYGGWRIGIRDLSNRYHYYAHLQGYEKNIEIGDVVKPGQGVGWVGSSGYGPPGTQGRFPPHLHYGIYRDTGSTEWAFNPYPLLRQWEKEEWVRIKKGKK